MKISIRTKVLPVVVLGILLTGYILHFVSMSAQKQIMNSISKCETQNASKLELALDIAQRKSILVVFLVLLAHSMMIMLVVNIVVVKPLRRMTEAGNKINAGEIDTPLPEITSNDEIKVLAATMDSMAGAIRYLRGTRSEGQGTRSKGKGARS